MHDGGADYSQDGNKPKGSDDQARRQAMGDLSVNHCGRLTFVRLSRPAKRNAITSEMVGDIEVILGNLPPETRVVILHGEGDNFSAGADLSRIKEATGLSAVSISRSWHRAFDRVEFGNVPVIAVLRGAVIGGGLELAAAAHIRVAERSAYYALPESARGIFVGGGGAVRVPRLIGTSRMIDMMLTGRTYSAEEGASLGLSQYLVEEGQGLAKAIELAERVADNTDLSNFAVIQALPRIARSESESGLLMESLMATATFGDPESKARIDAFLEKRASRVNRLAAGRG